MTRPEPTLPKFSFLSMDLFSLPGIGTYTRKWAGLLLANSAARREGKAVMFAELAEAARQGVPLDVALAFNSQTLGESRMRPRLGVPPGADSRGATLKTLFSIMLLLIGNIGVFFYAVFAMRYVDGERIARLLAMRLLPLVRAGKSLSEAMTHHAKDFSEQEIAIVRAGEQWGTVPAALKKIATYQTDESRMAAQGSYFLYPVLLAVLLSGPVLFIYVTIIPKFEDIFNQLGVELPVLTKNVIHSMYWLTHGFSAIALFAVLLLLPFLITRALLNGNLISRPLVVLPAIMLVSFAGLPIFLVVAFPLAIGLSAFIPQVFKDNDAVALLLAGVYYGALALLLPWVLGWAESIVLLMEKRAGRLIRWVPILSTVARAEDEARWLGALALGIESRLSPADAVRTAGRICGGRLLRRSEDAAQLVEKGHPIGAACDATRVLTPVNTSRLRFLDRSGDFLDGLRMIASDSLIRASELQSVAARSSEVIGMLLLGLVMGLFVASLYLPLFYIPRAVGFEI